MLSTAKLLASIERVLREQAPDNTATVPISMSKEIEDGGAKYWTYIQITRPGIADFSIESGGTTFQRSLQNCFVTLNAYSTHERLAVQGDARFGITHGIN